MNGMIYVGQTTNFKERILQLAVLHNIPDIFPNDFDIESVETNL